MLYLNELCGTGMKDKPQSLFCFGATHLQPPALFPLSVNVCVFVCAEPPLYYSCLWAIIFKGFYGISKPGSYSLHFCTLCPLFPRRELLGPVARQPPETQGCSRLRNSPARHTAMKQRFIVFTRQFFGTD